MISQILSSSLENRPTRLQRLLHQVLARDVSFVKTLSVTSVEMLNQKEPPSANEILDHSGRTTVSVRSVSLSDRMICVVHVKTDFLNMRIAVHY